MKIVVGSDGPSYYWFILNVVFGELWNYSGHCSIDSIDMEFTKKGIAPCAFHFSIVDVSLSGLSRVSNVSSYSIFSDESIVTE